MDFSLDPFNTSILKNIEILTSLVRTVKATYQYVKVVFDQKGLSLKGLVATVNVAPKKVTFVKPSIV
jgi:hypothetical protein